MSKEYELPSYSELGIRKLHSSEVTVQFARPISVFSDRFRKFSDSLSKTLGPGEPRPVELIHLNFGSEPANVPNAQPLMLRIEREAGTPFAENRYYSLASTSTERHLELLQEFEASAI